MALDYVFERVPQYLQVYNPSYNYKTVNFAVICNSDDGIHETLIQPSVDIKFSRQKKTKITTCNADVKTYKTRKNAEPK